MDGRWLVPLFGGDKYTVCYAFSTLPSTVLYNIAVYLDAVRTGIIFIAYPMAPILGARFLLKEKYSWRQKVCIRGIAVFSIVFCAADYVI